MRVAEPEADSWSSLYTEHAQSVWAFLLKLGLREADAEDALHEVFLIAARRLDSFDATRGTRLSWLFGISANVARAARRKTQGSANYQSEPDGLEAATEGDNGPEAIARTRLRAALIDALGLLSPEGLEVFVLFELEGVGCVQIAEQLRIPVGTVYSRLNKAREFLRSALQAQRTRSPHHDR